MADAISDITTLAGAFGSFTKSLATLHETKVRVEQGLIQAQIEKANNDFLQRFNLAYGDQNRLTSENYMAALDEHGKALDEYLGTVRGGKAVESAVSANLMPVTEGFITAVGNKMITVYREETQAKRLATGDAISNGGGTRREIADKLRAWNSENVSMGYFDPEKQAEIDKSVRVQVAMADADDLITTYKTPAFAADHIPEGLDKLEMTAMTKYIKDRQDGIDAQFGSQFDASYVEKAKAEVLEEGDSAEWAEATREAYKAGRISKAEYDKTISKIVIYGRKAMGSDIVSFGNSMFDVLGAGPWSRADANNAIAELMRRFGKVSSGSTELQTKLKETISRFNAAAPSEEGDRTEERNRIMSEFYLRQDATSSSSSGYTEAGLLSYLNAQVRARPELGLASWADTERTKLHEKLGITSGPLDSSEQLQWARGAIVDPAVVLGPKKDIDAYFDGKSKQDRLVQAKMDAIMFDTETAYYMWLNKKPSASQSEKRTMFQELFKTAATAYQFAVEPIKKNLWGTQSSNALFQGMVDKGVFAQFNTENLFGNSETATSLAAAIQSNQNEYSRMFDEAKSSGYIDKNVKLVPKVFSGDTYIFSDDGRFVYDQTTEGTQLVIKWARADRIVGSLTKAVLDSLVWEKVQTKAASSEAPGRVDVQEPYETGIKK